MSSNATAAFFCYYQLPYGRPAGRHDASRWTAKLGTQPDQLASYLAFSPGRGYTQPAKRPNPQQLLLCRALYLAFSFLIGML